MVMSHAFGLRNRGRDLRLSQTLRSDFLENVVSVVRVPA